MIPLSWLATHFVADFLLQTSWMANGKSKRLLPLIVHASVYSLCFFWLGWAFVALTFVTHAITDGITSRITRYLHETNRIRPFFMVIGADQLIHYATLIATGKYLGIL